MNNQEIFILNRVIIHKVTQKDLDIAFIAYQIRFPDRTYEQFLKHHKDKYKGYVEQQGYFLDEKTAIETLQTASSGINEAGTYPYIIVSSMPINCIHPHTEDRTHRLFHFNEHTRMYEEIDWTFNEETQFLKNKEYSGLY